MKLEYEKCFQPLIDKGASRHIVTAEDTNLTISLDTLVEHGVIVGQGTLLENDVIYYLNPERTNTQEKPVHLNGTPLYATPEERLKRPVELKNGKTRIINIPTEELIPMLRESESRVYE